MVNDVIWKDTIFSGTEDYLEYRISKNVVTPVYYGKAFRSPSSGRYEINISDKARSFLKPHISSSAWTTVDGVYETEDFAATFAIQDLANSAVSLEQFYLQYTTAEDFIGGAKISARPINGHIDPRMKMMWAKWDYLTRNVPVDKGYKYFEINIVSGSLDYEFSGGTNTVVFEATGPDYTIYTDDEWLHITGSDGTYEITADINTGETRTGYICAQWYNAQFQLEEKCFEVRQKQDYASMYFTLEALSAGTLNLIGTLPTSRTEVVYYNVNDSSWVGVPVTASTSISINSGDKIRFRSTNKSYFNTESHFFNICPDFECNAYGNFLSLVYGNSFRNYTTLPTEVSFRKLFVNSKMVSAGDIILPSNAIQSCYWSMFQNSTLLTTAPRLPASGVPAYCYESMFQDCLSLITPPVISAISLGRESCRSMFQNCASLTTAPALPATTLNNGTYWFMFQDCIALTTAPTLPATAITQSCYRYMFKGCTSLVTAPALPATTIATAGYEGMFSGCTSLVTAPEIMATTLAGECCSNMFENCVSLTTAPVLLGETLKTWCYNNMFHNCTKLKYIKCLATDGFSSSGCLGGWVNGVSSTGTFVKKAGVTWPTGISGIPDGWTVIEE